MLSAVLPSGRAVRLRVSPAPASAAGINAFLRRAEQLERRRQSVLRAQATSLDRLARRVARDTDRLSKAQVDNARGLGQRLGASAERINRRLSSEIGTHGAWLRGQMKRERDLVRGLSGCDLWDKLVIASSAPLFAAYGQPGRLFGTNSMALTLSLAMWLLGDEVAHALSSSRDRKANGLRTPDVWSMLAPAGNLLTGWWLMHHRQHERFVAGVAQLSTARASDTTGSTVPSNEVRAISALASVAHGSLPRARADKPSERSSKKRPSERICTLTLQTLVDLSTLIAPDHVEDFRTFSGVPAVASVVRLAAVHGVSAKVRGISAEVDGAALRLTATITASLARDHKNWPNSPIISDLQLAWIVDTQAPPRRP
jgi:hypothetical protein